MCVPVLEVEGFEADDVIGTLSQKAAAEGYEVFMVTPDKDYGQLVRPCCKLYKQKGDGIEIVDCDAIRAHYGFDDPTLVRDVLALWGDASDNIPGVPGIGEKGACKLVQTWGNGREHSLQRGADQGQAGREHRRVGRQIAACQEAHDDPAGRADRIPSRGVDDVSAQSGRTACAFRRIGFHDVPARSAKRGAARRERRAAAGPAASAGRDGTGQIGCRQEGGAGRAGRSLFAPADPAPAAAAPVADDEEVDETDALPAEPEMESAQTTPHDYRIVRTADELRAMIAEIRRYPEFCFDTETTGFDLFNDRIGGHVVRRRAARGLVTGPPTNVRRRSMPSCCVRCSRTKRSPRSARTSSSI